MGTTTFDYTGAEQTYVVPDGVTEIEVECWGAQGGQGRKGADATYGGVGGKGGYTKGKLAVTPGETLYIYVGGAGGANGGGYNGGGAGGRNTYFSVVYYGGGGGGASDIRQGGNLLADRKTVGAGGGGGGSPGSGTAQQGGYGGAAGGTAGADGGYGDPSNPPGGGGTQTAGGAKGGTGTATAGSSGAGGVGDDSTLGGGGGGSGYYGGGGAAAQYNKGGSGGGGGSSYIGGMVSGTTTITADVQSGNGLVRIKDNDPPNAPTLDNPVGGAVIDRTATNRFSLTPNDPDPGDTSSALEIRYRPIGAATWTTTGQVATTNHYYDFAAGTFAEGDHEWQARTWDAQGAVGPWATSEFFTAGTPPATPTITDPTSGQTIPSESYSVTHSAPDQDRVERRRVADNAGSPDTATVYWSELQASSTSRSRSVAFPTNNRWEHVQVRIEHNGLWSEWASVRVEVSWTSPPAPSVTAVGNDTGGYIAVAVDNPAPVGDEPSVTSNDLYRREVGSNGEGVRIARGIAPDGAYNDYAVASRQAVEYRARALGSNGTSSLSAWAG